jgi:hypothetical protein
MREKEINVAEEVGFHIRFLRKISAAKAVGA